MTLLKANWGRSHVIWFGVLLGAAIVLFLLLDWFLAWRRRRRALEGLEGGVLIKPKTSLLQRMARWLFYPPY
jgi:hypothetical protein